MIAVAEEALRQDVKQWSGLILTGAWVALASVALIVVQVVIYLLWPTPETTIGFFAVLVENPLRGLLALDLLYLVSNLLAYLLYFALAVVLWRVSRSGVVIALAFGVLGMAAYMASPRPIEMLQLARSYAEADPAKQLALQATGEGMLATWTGTAFDIYYIFNLVTLLVFAVLMYRSDVFTRATAVWGLVAAALMAAPRTSGRWASSSRWPHSYRGPFSRYLSLAGCSRWPPQLIHTDGPGSPTPVVGHAAQIKLRESPSPGASGPDRATNTRAMFEGTSGPPTMPILSFADRWCFMWTSWKVLPMV